MILMMRVIFWSVLSIAAAGELRAETKEFDAPPMQMGYEIVGTVPEEGFIIKGEGWTQIAYVTKDDTGLAVNADRLANLKAALEVSLPDKDTLRAAYRLFMVYPKEYWSEKGSDREESPSKIELEAPLSDLSKLGALVTDGHTERFSQDVAGAALTKLESLGYPSDEAFVTGFKKTISELVADLHAQIPNQLRWMYERYLEQVKKEAELKAEEEVRLKAEAQAARTGAVPSESAPPAPRPAPAAEPSPQGEGA